MLEKIQEMCKSPYIIFDQYFQDYVMRIQDDMIDNEIKFLLNNNFVNIKFLQQHLNTEFDSIC